MTLCRLPSVWRLAPRGWILTFRPSIVQLRPLDLDIHIPCTHSLFCIDSPLKGPLSLLSRPHELTRFLTKPFASVLRQRRATGMASLLSKRQVLPDHRDNYQDDDYYSWWYSDVSPPPSPIPSNLQTNAAQAGIAVKYALWSAFIIALLAYFIGGRIHASRRLRKGLPPLAYHRVSKTMSVSRTYASANARAVARFPAPKSEIRPAARSPSGCVSVHARFWSGVWTDVWHDRLFSASSWCV